MNSNGLSREKWLPNPSVYVIGASSRKGKEEKKGEYLRREITYGAFERRLTIPEGAQADQVKAEFKNGVFEITVPLVKEVAARKISLVEAK